jgi:hypothetical protein
VCVLHIGLDRLGYFITTITIQSLLPSSEPKREGKGTKEKTCSIITASPPHHLICRIQRDYLLKRVFSSKQAKRNQKRPKTLWRWAESNRRQHRNVFHNVLCYHYTTAPMESVRVFDNINNCGCCKLVKGTTTNCRGARTTSGGNTWCGCWRMQF